jgi:hypothetical protein
MGKALPHSKAHISAQKNTAGGQVNRFSRLIIFSQVQRSGFRVQGSGFNGYRSEPANDYEKVYPGWGS